LYSLGTVSQGGDFEKSLSKQGLFHLVPAAPISQIASIYVLWAESMGISNEMGLLPMGVLFPYSVPLDYFSMVDKNLLCGYVVEGAFLSVSNCFLTDDAYATEAQKTFEIYREDY